MEQFSSVDIDLLLPHPIPINSLPTLPQPIRLIVLCSLILPGNTETVAGYMADSTGIEAVDIADVDGATVAGYDGLIIGAPTWHTGADTERSGTSWDDFLYGELTSLDLKGKKVAVFGVGDREQSPCFARPCVRPNNGSSSCSRYCRHILTCLLMCDSHAYSYVSPEVMTQPWR